MVAGGAAPLLFVWDLAAAELLYALHLPIPQAVYGTVQLHFMPDSQTVAGWAYCPFISRSSNVGDSEYWISRLGCCAIAAVLACLSAVLVAAFKLVQDGQVLKSQHVL